MWEVNHLGVFSALASCFPPATDGALESHRSRFRLAQRVSGADECRNCIPITGSLCVSIHARTYLSSLCFPSLLPSGLGILHKVINQLFFFAFFPTHNLWKHFFSLSVFFFKKTSKISVWRMIWSPFSCCKSWIGNNSPHGSNPTWYPCEQVCTQTEIVRIVSVFCVKLFLCKREPVSCVSAAFVSLRVQFGA